MTRIYLMGLCHKWIFRHKLRYVLSWISFALVSVVVITIYSLGFSLQKGITDSLESNPLKQQISVKNTARFDQNGILHALDVPTVLTMREEIQAEDLRVLCNNSLYITKINQTEIELSYGKASFVDNRYSFLLNSDIAYLKYMAGESDKIALDSERLDLKMKEAIVTEAFVSAYGLDMGTVIGTLLTFADENNAQYTYTITNVILRTQDHPILGSAYVYLPYNVEDAQAADDGFKLSTASFELNPSGSLAEAVRAISSYGYSYFSFLNNADHLDSMKYSIAAIGTTIGILLLLLASFGLINSIMTTINENRAFMNFFRMIGLTGQNYKFIILYMSILHGMIGGWIGGLAALLFQSNIYALLGLFGLQITTLIDSFTVEPAACFYVLAFCTAVSFLSGLLSAAKSSKQMSIHDID